MGTREEASELRRWIRAHPGRMAEAVAVAVRRPIPEVRLALESLEGEGQVRRAGDPARPVWFLDERETARAKPGRAHPTDPDVPGGVRVESALPGDRISADLVGATVDALVAAPGAKVKELTRIIGAPSAQIRAHLEELEKVGIVYHTGRTTRRWFVG